MKEYETHTVIKTNCESLYDIMELVAEFFIDNRDEEEVFVEDVNHGKLKLSIYDSDIVKCINSQLQVAHFGGTIE
jgi:hypothetical protein